MFIRNREPNEKAREFGFRLRTVHLLSLAAFMFVVNAIVLFHLVTMGPGGGWIQIQVYAFIVLVGAMAGSILALKKVGSFRR